MVQPKVVVIVQADDQVTKEMTDISNKSVAGLDTFAMAIQHTGATIAQMGSQVSGYLDEINNSFFELEMKIAEAATIIGESAGGYEAVAADVDLVSESMGNAVSKVEFATAAYDIYSTGITDLEDRQYALQLASEASIAGITDAATATRAGIGAINAFGLSIDDLSSVYDIQFNLVEKGVITYEQYANVAGRVNAAASQVSQSLQVTSAALAAVTKTGIPAQQAAFRTQAAFLALQKVSEDEREELSKLGVQIMDSSGNYNSMVDIIFQLKSATEGLSDVEKTHIITLMAQDVRAQSGITSLMKMSDEFAELSVTIDEAGSMEEKYNIITATMSFELQEATNRMEDARAKMGESLAPATVMMTNIQADFYEKIAGINPELLKYGGSLLMITGHVMSTIGPIMQMIGSMLMLKVMKQQLAIATVQYTGAENISTLAKIKATIAQWAFNTSLYGCPLIWIAAAIIGVVVVLVILEKKFGLVSKTVDLLSKGFGWLWDKIKGLKENILLLFPPLFLFIKYFDDIRAAIGKLGGALDFIWDKMKAAFDIGAKLYDMGKEALGKFIDGIKDGLAESGDILGDVAGKIAGYFGGSLPREGELKHIYEYGGELMTNYTAGMERQVMETNINTVTSNIISHTTTPASIMSSPASPVAAQKTIVQNIFVVDFEEFMERVNEKTKEAMHDESISI